MKKNAFTFLSLAAFILVTLTVLACEIPSKTPESKFPVDGEYVFTLKSLKNTEDTYTVSFKPNLMTPEFDPDIVVKKNDVILDNSVLGNKGVGMYSLRFSIVDCFSVEIDDRYILDLRITHRNDDYDFDSLTFNGARQEVTVQKKYELAGKIEVRDITDVLNPIEIIEAQYEVHPGQKISIQYVNGDEFDKYYLGLFESGNDPEPSAYRKGIENADVFTYTFTDADIGKRLGPRAEGIEEYKGSHFIFRNTICVVSE